MTLKYITISKIEAQTGHWIKFYFRQRMNFRYESIDYKQVFQRNSQQYNNESFISLRLFLVWLASTKSHC